MSTVYDPYGEKEFGDWEDPHVHLLLTGCGGCPMCVTWPGKSYGRIRAERAALVSRRRLAAPEQTTAEVAREDRNHWSQRYAG